MLKYLPLVTIALATPAIAQTADDVIVTAARAPQDIREVGQAVTVIDRATIDERQAVSVADLLATTPGITVTRNGSFGGLTGLRVRGAEADQTLVVIDGIRVNDPSSTGGGFDFANLLSSSVERIEVLRGPDSVPWGSQAIGGVVNIITREPTDGLQARGRAEYGYHDTLFASGGLSGSSGAFSGAIDGGYLRTDGVSSAAAGTERDGYRQYGASGRVGVELSPGIGIDLRGYWAESRVSLDGYAPPTYAFGDTPEYSTTQELYGYAGIHADFADGGFRNRAAFTIADIDRDNYDPTTGTAPSFIGRGRSERFEYQGDFRPIDAVRLVAGAEHETQRYADGFDRFSTGITSFYGQAIVKPITPLTITGGIRNDDHRQFGNHTTGAANAALALGAGTTLRASYAEGFKAPTLYQLKSAYGNVALQPETARNYDIGIEQAFLDDRARVAVTYFNRHTNNQIDFRSCAGAAECAAYPFGRYDNIRRTEADGVEATIALRPVDALTFSGNYSYIYTKNRTAGANFGNDLARRPRQTVSANVDWRSPWGVALGATVSHVGDSFDDAANTVRLEGYVLAGIRAELPIGERFVVYGRVDNLFDEKYQVVSGYGTYGRAAYAGVRFRFE